MSIPRPARATITSSSRARETRDALFGRLKQRLVEFWNSEQLQWDATMDEISANSPSREAAASFIREGSRILDIACGTTANAKWLTPRGLYFGIDISQSYLRRAQQPGLRLGCADAERLPFNDASFDAAILTFALEHSVNPVGMLKEMWRVVRPSGRIVLLGPSWDLPFWYPNALRTKARKPLWRLAYTAKRALGQLGGWLFGRLPFFLIDDPDALHREFECDADAVYVVWSYEVITLMKRWGCRLIHAEVDDRMWGSHMLVRFLKRLLFLLPPYRYAGSTALIVFER